MGKWSSLKDQLEAAPQDRTYQERVNEAKGLYNDQTSIGELGETFGNLRKKKDKIEDELGDVNLQLEAVQQLLLAKLEDAGLTSVKLEDGSSLSVKDDPYSQVQDRGVFLNWIREKGYGELLTVHYQTMSSLVKERLVAGEEPPPGIKVFIKTSITRRKGPNA